MKLDRHIKVDEELHDKILLLSKESKLSYSDEVSLLVAEALSNRIKQTQLDKMQNDILYLVKKVNLLYSLVKQMYSDFNINPNNITDPKTSPALNEFLRKVKVNRLDD